MAFELVRDGDAVKQALICLFEESLAWHRLKPTLESTDEADRELQLQSLPERKLSPGFYRLAEYLMWLGARMQATALRLDLLSFEAEGLCILSQARSEFESNHPPCGRCGEMQDSRMSLMCWCCGQEFKR